MRRLGIIGGAGPFASALFYEMLLEESYRQKGEIPDLLLINYPFTNGLSVKGLKEGNSDESSLREGFFHCYSILAQNKIDTAVVVSNTLHLYLSSLPDQSIKFFHIPNLVLEEKKKYRSLLVLGTRITRDSHFYHHPHIEMHYPSSEDQKLIDEIIDRILSGKIRQEDSHAMTQIIKRCEKENDFDAVVLGCTDFPVLHRHYPIESSKPILDSLAIPAKKIISFL